MQTVKIAGLTQDKGICSGALLSLARVLNSPGKPAQTVVVVATAAIDTATRQLSPPLQLLPEKEET